MSDGWGSSGARKNAESGSTQEETEESVRASRWGRVQHATRREEKEDGNASWRSCSDTDGRDVRERGAMGGPGKEKCERTKKGSGNGERQRQEKDQQSEKRRRETER